MGQSSTSNTSSTLRVARLLMLTYLLRTYLLRTYLLRTHSLQATAQLLERPEWAIDYASHRRPSKGDKP